MSSRAPVRQPTFDFRLAMGERERAIRALEQLLRHSANSGESPHGHQLAELLAVITGRFESERDLAMDSSDIAGS